MRKIHTTNCAIYAPMQPCLTVSMIQHICDRICENVHSSHFHFFNFEDSLNLLCTSEKHETCRDCSVTIPLSVQQISDIYLLPIMFYEPLNVQNQMCELCTFSQIRSHM